MWLKKLKKKKFQFLLTGLMLMFTMTIFSACICFVAETKIFTKNFTSYENCPRIVALVDRNYDYDYFSRQDELMADTKEILFTDAAILDKSFYSGSKKVRSFATVVNYISDVDNFIYNIEITDGEKKKCPGNDEIWICSVCADSNNLKVGDILQLGDDGSLNVTVSGIVAVPVCPSPMMGLTPFYMNRATAEKFGGTPAQSISFYTGDPSVECDEYLKMLPDEFKENAFQLTNSINVGQSISYISDIFGGIGIIASLVIFVVSLVIINFIITSTLSKEYRSIGTYKALGFTNSQIIGFYLKSFLFAGSAGITAGIFLSMPLAQYFCSSVLRDIGEFRVTSISVYIAAGCAVLLILLLTSGILLSLKKIRKITPVEAFSIESASTKSKIGRSLIKNAYSPLSTAVNDIFRRKKASILTILILIVSFYMSLMFSTVNYSIEKLGDNTSRWFALPEHDAIIMTGDKKCEDYLTDNDMVVSYTYYNNDVRMVGLSSDKSFNPNEVYLTISSDLSEKAMGIPLIDGRYPKANDEILMSYSFMRSLGLDTGDWFSVSNDSYSNDYLITGTYSSMYNMGKSLMMNGDEYTNFSTDTGYTGIYVKLADGITIEDFTDDCKANGIDYEISDSPSFLDGTINALLIVSGPLTTMLVIIFSLFSVLNIINLLLMNNLENRRQFGILKAMGFTDSYICIRGLLKIMILTVIAAAAALAVHLLFSQAFFFCVICVEGLIYNTAITCGVTGILILAIIIITLLFSIPLKKVLPKDLMEE
ncbi:MAG: ABC transporter permease [Oscillospiraceae bacterium]|nr:ABC transporter permease [Oscillospiraceae bacterium]